MHTVSLGGEFIIASDTTSSLLRNDLREPISTNDKCKREWKENKRKREKGKKSERENEKKREKVKKNEGVEDRIESDSKEMWVWGKWNVNEEMKFQSRKK